MTNPEMTKNTSTPTYPPGSRPGAKWNPSTAATARARSAWTSVRTSRRARVGGPLSGAFMGVFVIISLPPISEGHKSITNLFGCVEPGGSRRAGLGGGEYEDGLGLAFPVLHHRDGLALGAEHAGGSRGDGGGNALSVGKGARLRFGGEADGEGRRQRVRQREERGFLKRGAFIGADRKSVVEGTREDGGGRQRTSQ